MLHADLELSEKPADQIAAIERYLVFAKEYELRVFSLYKSQAKAGEADKYEKAKYMRLDAEIQLLRAKRNAVTPTVAFDLNAETMQQCEPKVAQRGVFRQDDVLPEFQSNPTTSKNRGAVIEIVNCANVTAIGDPPVR